MKIDILNVVEQADGSAVVIADLDNEAIMILAEIGSGQADDLDLRLRSASTSLWRMQPKGL